MIIFIFDYVECIDEDEYNVYGPMQVVEIQTEEQADSNGCYPYICRSDKLGLKTDFVFDELQIIA